MKLIQHFVLIMVLNLCLNQSVYAKERMFDLDDVQNLCTTIRAGNPSDIANRMDRLVRKANITKAQWNEYYVYKVYCLGSSPMYYALSKEVSDFKALADYGVDLSHPIIGDEGEVTTVKDYVINQIDTGDRSDLSKFRKIRRILKKKKAKSCADMPLLPCGKVGATYMQEARELYYRHYQK